MFKQTLIAGWGDMDFNSHMRNTAYLDKAVDVRMTYFAGQGFPVSEFRRLGIGPVVINDQIEYFREFHLLDSVECTLCLAGLSEDGSQMRLRNEFFRKGKLAARVTSTGGWLDLTQRRMVNPPALLLAALQALARSTDFQDLQGGSNPFRGRPHRSGDQGTEV
ncbi:acyl-CoA thioester hydrolase [Pseudomonas sp. F-14 TE3623]|uniref:thioesterase family protein n=1 Tax=Pseudomonas TaxID=286 RepID=UPI0002724ABE|nr:MULTISPECIES: thioesterase family protein [unclassified Pseudomonas]MBD9599803.1 thioesterase family protein [Pseudomonas sp. PDM10]WIE49827.1 thioesterase family protein [Pseudomonas sp. GM17]